MARQIGADLDIKKDQEIKVNLKNNQIINQNQNHNQKEDIIIETKIPDEISQDKNIKLKKIEENEKKDEIKEEDEKIEKNETGILSKNHFNQRVFELINQIRLNPPGYSKTILDNIENIILETHKIVNKKSGVIENKQTYVFKKKVKVNLNRGEACFREVADILKNTPPMEKLKFSNNIVIPLPNNEEDIINSTFIKSKANEVRKNSNINVYFKEYIKNPEIAVLLMIVDDTEVIIGSANINDRSMLGTRDSEFAVLIKENPSLNIKMDGDDYNAANFAHSFRVHLLAEHLGLDPKNQILKDPLSDELLNLVQNTAKNNTLTYRKIWGCYPDDQYLSFKELKNWRKIKKVQTDDELRQIYNQEKNNIVGHIVEFPLHFLEKENLGISFFSVENIVPERNFT